MLKVVSRLADKIPRQWVENPLNSGHSKHANQYTTLADFNATHTTTTITVQPQFDLNNQKTHFHWLYSGETYVFSSYFVEFSLDTRTPWFICFLTGRQVQGD